MLPDLPWPSMTHRETLAELILSGWTPCGVGDWATGLRSPDGLWVARVCPFDPAYAAFLELCRLLPDNPYLPRIAHDTPLDGGGTLSVLEYLTPLDPDLALQWNENSTDPALTQLRQAAVAVDNEFRGRTPWWDGIDLNAGNVRQALDGRIAIIDIFCMDGAALYAQILDDATVVSAAFPGSRHVLDIPYIARESTPTEITALHNAWSSTSCN